MSSSEQQSQQLALGIECRESRDVRWFVYEEKQPSRLQRWMGKPASAAVIIDRNGLPTTKSINSADINKLHDPNLAYALRLADAANAIGMVAVDEYTSYAHSVEVQAIGTGVDSVFVGAIYTGNGDDFQQHLEATEARHV